MDTDHTLKTDVLAELAGAALVRSGLSAQLGQRQIRAADIQLGQHRSVCGAACRSGASGQGRAGLISAMDSSARPCAPSGMAKGGCGDPQCGEDGADALPQAEPLGEKPTSSDGRHGNVDNTDRAHSRSRGERQGRGPVEIANAKRDMVNHAAPLGHHAAQAAAQQCGPIQRLYSRSF